MLIFVGRDRLVRRARAPSPELSPGGWGGTVHRLREWHSSFQPMLPDKDHRRDATPIRGDFSSGPRLFGLLVITVGSPYWVG